MSVKTKKKAAKSRNPDRAKYDPDRIMREQGIDPENPVVIHGPTDGALPAGGEVAVAPVVGLPWQAWEVRSVALKSIFDDGENPRGKWEGELGAEEKRELAELAASIQVDGVMQPIGVSPRMDGAGFVRIFGSRRCAAAKLAGLEEIQAKVSPVALTPERIREYRAAENRLRRQLNPAEMALEAAGLVKTYTKGGAGWKEAIGRAAGKLHCDEKIVRDAWLVIEGLSPETRGFLAAGGIHLGHARALAEVKDLAWQAEIAWEIAEDAKVDDQATGALGRQAGRIWSVAEVRNRISLRKHSLRVVPWELGVAMKGRPTGRTACLGCVANTATRPALPGMPDVFEENKKAGGDGEGAGTCTDAACFAKSEAIVAAGMKEGVAELRSEIKGKKIAKEEAAGAAAVRRVMPGYVKMGSAVRVIKRELGVGEEKKGKGGEKGAVPEKREKSAKELQQEALLEWGRAFGAWTDGLFGKIVVLAEKDAAVKAAAILLSMNLLPRYRIPREDYMPGNGTQPEEEKALTPSQSKLLDAAGKRDLAALLLLAEDAEPGVDVSDVPFSLAQNELDCGPELCRRLAKAFGIEVGAAPVFGDFLPAELQGAGKKGGEGR